MRPRYRRKRRAALRAIALPARRPETNRPKAALAIPTLAVRMLVTRMTARQQGQPIIQRITMRHPPTQTMQHETTKQETTRHEAKHHEITRREVRRDPRGSHPTPTPNRRGRSRRPREKRHNRRGRNQRRNPSRSRMAKARGDVKRQSNRRVAANGGLPKLAIRVHESSHSSHRTRLGGSVCLASIPFLFSRPKNLNPEMAWHLLLCPVVYGLPCLARSS